MNIRIVQSAITFEPLVILQNGYYHRVSRLKFSWKILLPQEYSYSYRPRSTNSTLCALQSLDPDATHPRSAGGAGHTRHCRPSPGAQRPTHHPPRVSAAALAIRLSLDVSAAGLAILSLDVSATAPAITSVPGRASLGEEGATAG